MNARPFLKWAGGKKQLLDELSKRLSQEIIKSRNIPLYIEPFVGGGSFFFYLKNNYNVEKSYLLDINQDLILTYKVIKNNSDVLIELLSKKEREYLSLNPENRQRYFYNQREQFNAMMEGFNYSKYHSSWVLRAALVIFLNRTCFNGLFRQNSRGFFNVPFGRYSNPKICDKENIKEVAIALKNTKLMCGDFEKSRDYIIKNSLIYLDPPYRPINKTSHFTRYSKDGFNDEDQKRLARYFREANKKEAFVMLSNSDPKNINKNDNFFDELYKGYNIQRVKAKRLINSKSIKRGTILEILITNY